MFINFRIIFLCFLIITSVVQGRCLLYIDDTYLLDETARVYILYPLDKERKPYNLYVNSNLVLALKNGQRVVYYCPAGKLMKFTLLNSPNYIEPSVLAGNTRSIHVKAGKEYYLEISGNGEISYMSNPQKAKEKFEDNAKYLAVPITVSATASDSLSAHKILSNN